MKVLVAELHEVIHESYIHETSFIRVELSAKNGLLHY